MNIPAYAASADTKLACLCCICEHFSHTAWRGVTRLAQIGYAHSSPCTLCCLCNLGIQVGILNACAASEAPASPPTTNLPRAARTRRAAPAISYMREAFVLLRSLNKYISLDAPRPGVAGRRGLDLRLLMNRFLRLAVNLPASVCMSGVPAGGKSAHE